MSILGKLLIVFNLLAAGAFAYFTLENWHLRQDITWAALERQVRLDGIALEAQDPPPSAEDLGEDRVAFAFSMPDGGPKYTSIQKKRFDSLIPKGGDKFGGNPVADQTAEVKRLKEKAIKDLPPAGQANPTPRFQWFQVYLLSLAKTGAERDGVNALFDLRDLSKRNAARRDLPFLARTSSQVSALRTIVDITDLHDPQAIMPDTVRSTRIGQARESVKRLLLGEVSHGVPAAGDKADAERNLKNAVDAALRDRAGDAEKRAIIDAAKGDTAGWTQLADVAVEPLADSKSIERAVAGLLAYAEGKAATLAEKTALGGIKTLIIGVLEPPPLGFVLDNSIESVALELLNSKFDEAALPAASGTKGKGDPAGEKARKIAHLLYHIDAWRHADKTPAAVADRKAWHERVATIVGLPEYIRAAESQATEYAEAGQRLISVITEEQSAFETEYQAQLQRVLFLYSQWLVLDNQLKGQEAITKENERLRAERETERNKLVEDLKQATEDAKTALAKLKVTQGRLFAIQKQLRDAQAAILALEKELRRIELKTD